jgi:hypothetical protein
MIKRIALAVVITVVSLIARAQNASVQFIQNCPHPDLDTIDLYINNNLVASNLAFRSSTAFLSASSGTQLNIAIAPKGSSNANEAIANFTNTGLISGSNNVIVINGTYDTSSMYHPPQPLDLSIYPYALQAGTGSTSVDLLFCNGSTDSPVLDIVESNLLLLTAAEDISFGEFRDYISIPTANYRLSVIDGSSDETYYSYEAPFALWNLGGKAITVVASGFFDPEENQNGASFGLWLSTSLGGPMIPLQSTSSRVQFVHNSADETMGKIDVYSNNQKIADDIDFRYATPYLDLPANVDSKIHLAEYNSQSQADAFLSFDTHWQPEHNYIAVLDGVQNSIGYSPAPELALHIVSDVPSSSTGLNNTDIVFLNGSTDGEEYNIAEAIIIGGNIFDNLSYGNSTPFIPFPDGDYRIQLKHSEGDVLFRSYELDLSDLGIVNKVISIISSGFLYPENNSDGLEFGLWIALPEGGALIEVPSSEAKIQLIQNIADNTLEFVDVYWNNVKKADNLEFRHSTDFISIRSEFDGLLSVCPMSSTGPENPIATLQMNALTKENYVAVINGIADNINYSPAPSITIDLVAGIQESSLPGETNFVFVHGATDLPEFDLIETYNNSVLLANDIAYSESTDNIILSNGNKRLTIASADGLDFIRSFEMPLAGLGFEGMPLVCVASGFLSTQVNNDGPALGLWLTSAQGGAMTELIASKARMNLIHNSADLSIAIVDVYLDDKLLFDDFGFRTSSGYIDFPAEVHQSISFAPSGSNSVSDAFTSIPLFLENDETFVAVMTGLFNPAGYLPAPPFQLLIQSNAIEVSDDPTQTDILFYHGSTDEAGIDIKVSPLDVTLIDNIGYGAFYDYIYFQTDNVQLTVTDVSGTFELNTYDAPLAGLGLQGSAIVLLASGFINPANNNDGPEFGLWAALPGGGALLEFPVATEPVYARAQLIHNSADSFLDPMDVYLNGDLWIDDMDFREAHSYVDVPASTPIQISIAPGNSLGIIDAVASFPFFLNESETYILMVNGVYAEANYFPVQPLDIHLYSGARENAMMEVDTDVLFYHGSTDAPNVNLSEITLPLNNFVDNISYNSFAGYTAFSAEADYVFRFTDGSGSFLIGEYDAPFSAWGYFGKSIVIFSSGFLNTDSNNNGQAIELWGALSDGTTFPLQPHVGINEVAVNSSSLVYPNPAKDLLYVAGTNQSNSPIKYTISDLNGKTLIKSAATLNNIGQAGVINVQSLQNGMYILKLEQGQYTEVLRFSICE